MPHQYVQEIKNVAESGAVLTRQLMTLSRKPLLQPQVLDFKRIISNLTPNSIPNGQYLFLQKPFTPATLLANVRKALEFPKA